MATCKCGSSRTVMGDDGVLYCVSCGKKLSGGRKW